MLRTAVSGQATWLPTHDQHSTLATGRISNGVVFGSWDHDHIQLPNQLQNVREVELHLVGVRRDWLDGSAQNRIVVRNRLLHNVATTRQQRKRTVGTSQEAPTPRTALKETKPS